ncbi:MAG: energy-coupled thiamine transporter ThiT [Clostridia bacterium]|nr:energy-coupled thiamine transporter ThiT [Clostridia bacterium]
MHRLVGDKEQKENHTKSIVYAAVCIALSFALSYIRFFKLPQGGSITLVSLLPLMIYSYMFGIRKGILAGFIYGVLQAIQDPWIIHPVQFLLDYPIAFAMIGLSGIFKKYFTKYPILAFILGGILAGVLRYSSHVISGIFAFSSFAGEGYSAVAWGFLYNSFALVDIAIAIIAGSAMFANKAFIKQLKMQ